MKKKIGFGSLSIILFIFAIVWCKSIKTLNNFCLGDTILQFIKLPAWETNPNGNLGLHYTVFYSLPILIAAIIIGHKFPKHIFAKSGKFLSALYALTFAFTWLVSSMTI